MTEPLSKRDRLARLACGGGLTRALEWAARRDCLLVLNYHRIGDRSATELDEEVFSADVDAFDAQVGHLKRRYAIITLEEALDLIEHARPFHGPAVLITFDDGYLDNYQAAFPVLRSHGVQGTFFLVASYLDDPGVAWWDRIAYWVRNGRAQRLRLSYPRDFELELPPGRRYEQIRQVLRFLREPAMRDLDRFLRELETACDSPPLPAGARAFLSWDEAREMAAAGMAIGSHTVSHEILSKLPAVRSSRKPAVPVRPWRKAWASGWRRWPTRSAPRTASRTRPSRRLSWPATARAFRSMAGSIVQATPIRTTSGALRPADASSASGPRSRSRSPPAATGSEWAPTP